MKWLFLIVAVIIVLLLIEVLFKLISLEDDIKSTKYEVFDVENCIKDVQKEYYRIEKILTVNNPEENDKYNNKLLELIKNLNNLINLRFDSQDNSYEILKQHLLELKNNLSSDTVYIQTLNSIINQLDSLKAQTFKQIDSINENNDRNLKCIESMFIANHQELKDYIDTIHNNKKAKNSSKNNGMKKVSPQGELSQNKAKNS